MKDRGCGVLQSEPSAGWDRQRQSGSLEETSTSSRLLISTEQDRSLLWRQTESHSRRESAKLKSIFWSLVVDGALMEK